MKARKILGAIFLIFGAAFLLNSRITGFVIVEEISSSSSFILGLIFVLIGAFLMIIEKEKQGGLEKEVFQTEHFKRAIKRHDPKAIERAIKKIGTGLGKEEKLENGQYSVRESKGGRIIFEKYYERGKETVRLVDYLPRHEYSRLS